MAIEAELPTTEEVANTESSFLSKPGTYHFAVMHADEKPQQRFGDNKGQYLDGFEIEASVAAGSEKGKSHRFFIRNPSPTHKDQGAFCKALRGKWLESIAVVDPSQRGKTVTIELVDSQGNVTIRGRQFIATMEMAKSQNGKDYLDLAGAKVWHPDDESADKCDRNQEALKLRPKAHCRDPKSFVKQSGSGNGSTTTKTPANQPASASAIAGAAAGVDMNNI